jgi:NADH-quinone oxidoreductase subunit A
LFFLAVVSVPLWPLAVYVAAVVLMVAGLLALSYVLGERHRERATVLPYESGMLPTGSARLRFSADFYLVAVFFVIFDLEAVFLFAWAVSARSLGWAGYAGAAVFVGVLLAALVYLWRMGALDWGTHRGAGEQRNGGTGERVSRRNR